MGYSNLDLITRARLKWSKEKQATTSCLLSSSLHFKSSKMKFGKRLQSQIEETMPEWRDKFLCYKQLKKRLKLMSAPACFTEAAFDTIATSPPWGGGGVAYHTRSSCVLHEVDQQLRSNAFTTTTHTYMGGGHTVSMLSDSLLETAHHHRHHHHPIRHVGGAETEYLSSAGLDFVGLLNKELNKFNHFFIEKEEEYVIRLQVCIWYEWLYLSFP